MNARKRQMNPGAVPSTAWSSCRIVVRGDNENIKEAKREKNAGKRIRSNQYSNTTESEYNRADMTYSRERLPVTAPSKAKMLTHNVCMGLPTWKSKIEFQIP